jgi:hypothetical protein
MSGCWPRLYARLVYCWNRPSYAAVEACRLCEHMIDGIYECVCVAEGVHVCSCMVESVLQGQSKTYDGLCVGFWGGGAGIEELWDGKQGHQGEICP